MHPKRRKRFLSLVLFSGLIALSGCDVGPRPLNATESELNGGSELTPRSNRLGIYDVSTFDGPLPLGRCTATLLYTSEITQESWLVTAAHCFSHINAGAFFVTRHASTPLAEIAHSRGTTDAIASTVHVHEDWLNNGGHTAWFGPSDVAFIHVNEYIPVVASDGRDLGEYHRAIYTGPADAIAAPNRWESSEWIHDSNAFCGRGNGGLWCDKLTNLWFSPNFRNEFLQLPSAAWANSRAQPPFEPGDSGGPLMIYSRRFSSRPWQLSRRGDLEATIADGVVLGVLQGPTVFCDYIQNGNCNPLDGLATHFEGMSSWIRSLPRGSLVPMISAPTTVSLDWRSSDLEWGVSYNGGDYASFNLSSSNPKLCRNACEQDSDCVAFTFVREGIQGSSPRCWLKNIVRPIVRRTGRVSGIVRSKPATDIALPEGNYRSLSNISPSGCRDRCAMDSQCVAYTHISSQARCDLKNSYSSPIQSQGTGSTSSLMRKEGLEFGIGRTGQDYRSFWVSEPNPRICQRVCVRESRCRAFTYVEPGVQGNQARCWLKRGVPSADARAGRVSGVVR